MQTASTVADAGRRLLNYCANPLRSQTDFFGLEALIAPCRLKFDLVVLLKRLITIAFDGRVMDEHVFTPVAWTDKPETLCTVEPASDDRWTV